MRLIYPLEQSAPNITELSRKLCAIVWTLYKPPGTLNYLPGLIVSLYSAKKWHESYSDLRLVVMVTPDVPRGDIKIISKLADHIWVVPYITRPVRHHANQADQANQWINSCFTKFNALSLPYKKIISLDCDTLVLQSLIDLFACDTPAARYAHHLHQPFGEVPNHYRGGRLFPAHGEKLPIKLINDSIVNGYVPNGGVMVLTPNEAEFTELMAILDTVIFGLKNCLSKPDDQALAMFYCKKNIEITNIKAVYNTPVFLHAYQSHERAIIMHFSGVFKPWCNMSYPTRWHQYACACQIQYKINLKAYSNYQVNTAVKQILRRHRTRCFKQNDKCLIMPSQAEPSQAGQPEHASQPSQPSQAGQAGHAGQTAGQPSQPSQAGHAGQTAGQPSQPSQAGQTAGQPSQPSQPSQAGQKPHVVSAWLAHSARYAAYTIASDIVYGYDSSKRRAVDSSAGPMYYAADRLVYDIHYAYYHKPWNLPNAPDVMWDILA